MAEQRAETTVAEGDEPEKPIDGNSARMVDAGHTSPTKIGPEVSNLSNPDWPTLAVRLVRSDERVRQALGFSDGSASNPVLA